MSSLPNFSEIKDLVSKGMTLEAQEKLMDFRELCLELREENLALKDRVKALEKSVYQQESVTYNGNVYMGRSERDAFCPNCKDRDGLLIHLQLNKEASAGRCNSCGHPYKIAY